jgi:RHS repeat-associated protein
MSLRLRFVFLLVAICFTWDQPDAKAQSTDRNYVISRSYKVASTSTSGNVNEASQSVSYVDGLGRPIQSVLTHGSAYMTGNVPGDLVTHVEYDSYGRVSKNYGSYPVQGGNGIYQSNASAKAVDYYNSGTNFCQPNNRGYEQLEYEQSHLNRVKKRYQVGSDRATEFSYGVNVANEVKWYNVSGSSVATTKSYTAAELSYVETKDENTKRTREYKDKNGRVVLRRAYSGSATLDTYYVYDDLSQLRFVLQPQYQESADLDKYAFKYEYNDRGLVSSKYVPGGGTTLMSYDARDRLTQSVDGRGKITYFKYDDQNRVIEIGEKRGAVEEGLVKTHYDNYNPPFDNVDPFVASGDGYSSTSRSNVTGYVTVTATRIVNPNGDYGNWLYATTYYDDRYNVIQQIRGLFDIGGTSKEYHSRLVSFHGRVDKELIKQETGTGNYSVEKIYAYDHSDRLLSTRYVVKKGTATTTVTKKDIILSAVRYDGLGMPKSKFLYSPDNGAKFREQLDNCFVPTGWLSKVTGKTSASDNFGVELKYTNPATATAQYNGNIAEMLWRRGGSAWVGFKFTYDDVNRLTNAEGIDGNKYRETISEYDKNGNIKFLQRYDDTTPWDDLTFSYGDKGRLMKVTDSGNSNGFNNGSSGTADDYNYDGNGNAIKDLNRGIVDGNLSYNHLNLIREVIVNGQTVQYHYDGNGQKLRMSNTNGAVNTKYAGIFEYDKSNYVTRIATEEGQITVTNNGNDYASEFYLKDHLGNVRMVMNEQGTTVQEMEYFPFGLAIPQIAGGNKYLYNGKEKQPETGLLDYGARQYDPSIGRWLSIDPLSEKTLEYSPFVYGNNNPIYFADPNGMLSTHTDENGNVVEVFDDGDLGVYKHKGNDEEATKEVAQNYSEKNTSAGGEKMGESLHSLSFADQNLYNSTGRVEKGTIKIDFGSQELTDHVKNIIDADPSLMEYQSKAGKGGDWDIKNKIANGSLLYGKYASPRDAGNFAAGAVAGSSLFEDWAQVGFGYYNIFQNKKMMFGALLATGVTSVLAPGIGGLLYGVGKNGEDILTQRSIDIGKKYIKSKK